MPSNLKCASLTPLLKKAGIDEEDRSSYHPISNLRFLSTVIEKVMARRIEYNRGINGLYDIYQSAYRKDLATETFRVCIWH